MNIQYFFQQWDLFAFGEKVLFLPLLIILVVVLFGLVLFLVIHILYGFVRFPLYLVSQTLEKTPDKEEEFKKQIRTEELTKKEEVIIGLKSGSWIIWIAVLPLVLCIILSILYLITLIPVGIF
jgi:succinate dehydrogenase/fumarate reductase cytochrome b subunit